MKLSVKGIVLSIGGFVLSVALVSWSICHFLANQHMLSATASEKQYWVSAIRASNAIILTRVRDAKTIVIDPADKRFDVISRETIEAIEKRDHPPAALYPKGVVIFRTDKEHVVVTYASAVIVINGHTFSAPPSLFDELDIASPP